MEARGDAVNNGRSTTMTDTPPRHPIDCVIFGGGVAGLFILDAVVRSGRSVLLLESGDLGAGQTSCAQGILHGGFKYTLRGLLTASAEAVAAMPSRWRDALDGRAEPDLTSVAVRQRFCHLWQTRSLTSALGMLGARAGLRTAPTPLRLEDRPEILRACPGAVARIDEQVIDPIGVVRTLSTRYRDRILRVDSRNGVELRTARGAVEGISLIRPDDGAMLDLAPTAVVFAAGIGNEALREACGLGSDACQRRPLHMAMVRGPLPLLAGHCVDGAKTRVTITSAEDAEQHVVWQLGGQLAEEGVSISADALVELARGELAEVLPGAPLDGLEWTTYHVDRAERRTSGRLRPDDAQLLHEGNVLTAWPTKLVLAPRLASLVISTLGPAQHRCELATVAGWPAPLVALPPWATARNWRQI